MSRTAQGNNVAEALKLLAKSGHKSFNDLRLLVALERAIARLERHPRLSEHLIFKGGFVLLKTTDTRRFTRDVDALAIGISRSSIVGMIEHALQLDLDDGLWFGDFEVTDLKDQGPYGGYTFNCAFQIGDPPEEESKRKRLSRLHLDVGFGDAIQAMTEKQPMKSLLPESKPVSWSIYPLEYIFAEKLDALFSRASANSRAKDVYDMPLIFPKCDLAKLRTAITQTFQKRETPIPDSFAATAATFNISVMERSWDSVDLPDGSITFEESWNALMSCLKALG
jgi:predicted nucleotidyltransferase component of viral defense system